MGADVLNDLTDVTLTSPASGEILQHNGSGQFVNVDLSSAGIAPASHSHVINDVTAPTHTIANNLTHLGLFSF